jgi:hypothetical protein
VFSGERGFVMELTGNRSHFVPRTPEIERRIGKEWEEARVLLDKDGNYSDAFYDVFGKANL